MCQKGQQQVPILKKTTVLCPSRSYYSMPTIQGQMDVNGSSGPVAGALVVPVSCLTPAAVTFLWDLFRFLATAFLQGGTNCAVVTWPKKDKSKRTLSLRFVNYCPWNQTAPGVSAKKYSTTQNCCTFSAISAKNDVPYTTVQFISLGTRRLAGWPPLRLLFTATVVFFWAAPRSPAVVEPVLLILFVLPRLDKSANGRRLFKEAASRDFRPQSLWNEPMHLYILIYIF